MGWAEGAAGALFGALSPGGRRGRLTVLIFHRVTAEPDPLQDIPTVDDFRRQMTLVREHCRPLPLAEGVRRLRAGTLPPRAVAVTFDDGYRDNHDLALPVLQALGVPATFFIATAYLDGGIMFNDQVIETVRRLPPGEHGVEWLDGGPPLRIGDDGSRRGAIERVIGALKYRPLPERAALAARFAALSPVPLPKRLMMESAQVRSLHEAGMTIGGHTDTHPILASVPPPQARQEIERGKARLEAITGAPVTLFAYPNGVPGVDYGPEHVAMVREAGFDAAVSTHWGAAREGADCYQLPRFTPWDRTGSRYLARLALNTLGGGRSPVDA